MPSRRSRTPGYFLKLPSSLAPRQGWHVPKPFPARYEFAQYHAEVYQFMLGMRETCGWLEYLRRAVYCRKRRKAAARRRTIGRRERRRIAAFEERDEYAVPAASSVDARGLPLACASRRIQVVRPQRGPWCGDDCPGARATADHPRGGSKATHFSSLSHKLSDPNEGLWWP